ncbi:hypothetical protein L9F63_005171, partial [Diploptera punctata]
SRSYEYVSLLAISALTTSFFPSLICSIMLLRLFRRALTLLSLAVVLSNRTNPFHF